MSTFVALIRGINVGGKNLVAMADLTQFLTSLGCVNARSVLQSGNLIFTFKGSIRALEIEQLLELESEKRLGRKLQFIVREQAEWKEVIAHNPFTEEATKAPNHLLVMFLKSTPSREALLTLKAAITGKEYFEAKLQELYLVYPDGIGHSKFTGHLIEKKLQTFGTGRNWNTVQKIAGLFNPIP